MTPLKVVYKFLRFIEIEETYFSNQIAFDFLRVNYLIQSPTNIRNNLNLFYTLHIDLTKPISEIFIGFKSNCKAYIKKYSASISVEIISSPTFADIRRFKNFYIQNKLSSSQPPINFDKIKRLAELNSIAISIASHTETSKTLIYHVLVKTPGRVRLLYSVTHDRTGYNGQIIGAANRVAHWEEINFFKKSNILIYDFGGVSLTNDSSDSRFNIDKFKFEFSNEVVREYSGLLLPKYVRTLIGFIKNVRTIFDKT